MSESNRPVKLGPGTLSVSDDGVNWRKVADLSSFEFTAKPNRPVIRYKPGYGPGGSVLAVSPSAPRSRGKRGKSSDDTSPYHVRRMRAALCDEFIATGQINPELMLKLRTYAESKREGRIDARRRSKNDPVGVQAESSTAVFMRRNER